MKEDFLLEIGTEEIPAGWIADASAQLENKICGLLSSEGISYDKSMRFYTPRRIAVLIKNVGTKQRDKSLEVTGPSKDVAFTKDGELSKAAIGFAEAHGISLGKLKLKKKGKKEVIYYEKLVKGVSTLKVLSLNLPKLMEEIEFPKSMKWEVLEFKFARPIRWIVALFDENIIPFEIASIKSGRKSQSLRGAPPINIESASSYQQVLRNNNVIVDFNDRIEIITKEIRKFEKEFKLTLKEDEELLTEVANLVEYPLPIIGKFDDKYLNLPGEVIIAALKTHQRYFALHREDKKLAPYFVVVVNTSGGEVDKIREGHERVLGARLQDAEFYYREDMKVPLEKRVDELKDVIWQEGLGTLYNKTQRLIELSKYIAKEYVPNVELNILEKAATFSKTDLVTDMIKDGKEFTKLEGLYGSVLARHQKLDPRIAIAIREHSLVPSVESSAEGVALAITDRVDTIVGAFISGKIPTGSSDPLGIRRAGNELVYIIIQNNLHMSLQAIISRATGIYKFSNRDVESSVFEFFMQRFRKYEEDNNIRYDIIEAVLGVPNEDLVDLHARINALNELKGEKDFITLVILAKRVRNILESKYQISNIKYQILKEPEEEALYRALVKSQDEFERYLGKRDYGSALNWLLNLAPLINNLFDKVLIMAPEPEIRKNRLALLNYLHSFFQKVADFSKIAE